MDFSHYVPDRGATEVAVPVPISSELLVPPSTAFTMNHTRQNQLQFSDRNTPLFISSHARASTINAIQNRLLSSNFQSQLYAKLRRFEPVILVWSCKENSIR